MVREQLEQVCEEIGGEIESRLTATKCHLGEDKEVNLIMDHIGKAHTNGTTLTMTSVESVEQTRDNAMRVNFGHEDKISYLDLVNTE